MLLIARFASELAACAGPRSKDGAGPEGAGEAVEVRDARFVGEGSTAGKSPRGWLRVETITACCARGRIEKVRLKEGMDLEDGRRKRTQAVVLIVDVYVYVLALWNEGGAGASGTG